jgi:copper(I)-binding protein
MINRRWLVTLSICSALLGSAEAHSYKLGRILIGHAWALPSQTSEAQVFVSLANDGDEMDELVGARSPVASLIELRTNNRYDDPPLRAMKLDPDKPLPMRPTARHLRLIGLTRSLVAGDRFPLILDFLNAGEVAIEVVVEPGSGE